MSDGEDIPAWQEAWMESARDPWLFATAVLGILPAGVDNPDGKDQLEAWQDEFLRPANFFCDAEGKPTNNPRHSIVSGHGTGKGMVLAVLALWFPLTHYDAKAVLTANSQDQLRDNNWPELRKWATHLPPAMRAQIQIDEERLYVKATPEMSFVVRRTASRHNPEALQGIHAKHVLYLIDEASGIEETIFEVAQGSLSTPGAIAVLMSNGTKASGFFYNTHHSMRHRWRCRRVNSEDVPRARGHIADIVEMYGKASNKYRVRVAGQFPTRDDDTVIPLELVEAAKGRDVVPLNTFLPLWGVDVARFGDDRCALAKRQANRLLEPVKWWSHQELDVTAGRIKAEWDSTPRDMRPSEILVDVIGYGAGVLVLLKGMGLPARGVNVAESAAISEEHHRLRDELWFKGRDWFQSRDCAIPATGCEELIGELCTPTYDFTVNGKKVVEAKKDMKKRGLRSPDLADAFLNTFASTPKQRETRRRQEAPFPAWAA